MNGANSATSRSGDRQGRRLASLGRRVFDGATDITTFNRLGRPFAVLAFAVTGGMIAEINTLSDRPRINHFLLQRCSSKRVELIDQVGHHPESRAHQPQEAVGAISLLTQQGTPICETRRSEPSILRYA